MSGLARFHEAQAQVWPAPLDEIRGGRKTTHWMWFVLPQLRGLGRSSAARHYGIADLAEARACLADPLLSSRLDEVAQALLAHAGTPAAAIMGEIDAVKLRSSATLFRAAGGGARFDALLETFCGGVPCPLTLAALETRPRP
jgi:uncharacterized protein (DUF1810 family)